MCERCGDGDAEVCKRVCGGVEVWSVEVWRFGVWKYGGVGVWKYTGVGVWKCGSMEG